MERTVPEPGLRVERPDPPRELRHRHSPAVVHRVPVPVLPLPAVVRHRVGTVADVLPRLLRRTVHRAEPEADILDEVGGRVLSVGVVPVVEAVHRRGRRTRLRTHHPAEPPPDLKRRLARLAPDVDERARLQGPRPELHRPRSGPHVKGQRETLRVRPPARECARLHLHAIAVRASVLVHEKEPRHRALLALARVGVAEPRPVVSAARPLPEVAEHFRIRRKRAPPANPHRRRLAALHQHPSVRRDLDAVPRRLSVHRNRLGLRKRHRAPRRKHHQPADNQLLHFVFPFTFTSYTDAGSSRKSTSAMSFTTSAVCRRSCKHYTTSGHPSDFLSTARAQ